MFLVRILYGDAGFGFGLGQRSVLHVTRISSSNGFDLQIYDLDLCNWNLLFVDLQIYDLDLSNWNLLSSVIMEAKIQKVMSGTLRLQTKIEHSGLLLKCIAGAGILLNKDGYILTNAHVVSDSFNFNVPGEGMALAQRWLAGKVLANFEGEEQCDAEVLSVDVGNDVALLKIPESVIKPSNIPCDFSKDVPGRGDKFFVVGHPDGLPFVVQHGHVSNPSRPPCDIPENILTGFPHSVNQMDRDMKFLELGVMAAPGFSGGPLSTVEGLVFGVLHAGMQGIAYGIPAAIIEKFLVKHGFSTEHP